jgi:hypothetical protein
MTFENIVEQILKDKGYSPSKLGQDIYNEFVSDGVAKLQEKINYSIFEAIPESELDSFNDLAEKGDGTKLQAFILKAVPNTSELTAQAIKDFTDNYFPKYQG